MTAFGYVTDIQQRLSNSDLGGFDMAAFANQSTRFQQNMICMSDCLLEYQQLLDDVSSWLSEVSASLSSRMDKLDLSSAANLYSTLQDNFINQFVANKMFYTQQSLQPLVDYVSILNAASLSMNDIDSSVFTKLTSTIDSLETVLKNAYNNLAVKFGDLNGFMDADDKIVDEFLRGRGLWRHPYVSLENQQVRSLFVCWQTPRICVGRGSIMFDLMAPKAA
jgi:hypothetical protein